MYTLISTHPFLGNGDMECSWSPLLLSLTECAFQWMAVSSSHPTPEWLAFLLLSSGSHTLHYLIPFICGKFLLLSLYVSAAIILLECSDAPGCGLKISGVMWRGGKVPSVSLRSAFSGTLRNHACYCTVYVFTYVLMLDAYCTSTVFSFSHEYISHLHPQSQPTHEQPHKINFQGLETASVAKSTDSSCRRPVFCFQHEHGGS